MKKILLTVALASLMSGSLCAQSDRTHIMNSETSSLVVTTNDGDAAYYQYFGPKIQN